MFRIVSEPIQPLDLHHVGAGGFVLFEGKVRDRNDGRAVQRLEYEAFSAMAESEGQLLLDEATRMFGLLEAKAVHRVGLLELGETAVWIGVAAPHRGEAFRACEYIIDELKKRVPIWKKEHYVDGDSGWIGCDSGPGDDVRRELYRRQTILPEVGEGGQAKLAASKVLLIGAGGLGSGAAPYLAAAGVGTIAICEPDIVDVSNLHRQVMFDFRDTGLSKLDAARRSLESLNPFITIETIKGALTDQNASEVVSGFDLVIDGTDNFATKFALNAACVRARIPLITASVHRFEGQIMAVEASANGGCLRCMWPEAPFDGCVGTCAEVGVLGVVPGLFGVLQANEALKVLLGFGEPLTDSTLLFDLKTNDSRRIRRSKRADCPVCGSGVETSQAIDLREDDPRVTALVAIDIREPDEWDLEPGFGEAERIPTSEPERLLERARATSGVLLVCASGARSARLARELRKQGVEAYSLLGGLARR